jgi:hypothetical protein
MWIKSNPLLCFLKIYLLMVVEKVSIMCWNVHDLGDPNKYNIVKDYIREVNASILHI